MGRVAITDYTFPTLEVETGILEAAGHTVVSGQCKTPEALIPLVADADAVIAQFAPVNADVVAAMKQARVIVRYGIGYDNVACNVARERGIPVCNVPDYCIDEVADHTLAFILSITRCLRANCAHMVKGNWGLGVPLEHMRALRGHTVGIIGLGRIGQAVAGRLRAFQCQLLAFDPLRSQAEFEALGCVQTGLDELLAQSDVVTLHCPSNEQTKGIIDGQALTRMKENSILINVGRGDLVDLGALTAALQAGKLAGAALDVFEQEPLPSGSPLLVMNNVIVSSHVASTSPTASQSLRTAAAEMAVAALRGERLPNVVNGVET